MTTEHSATGDASPNMLAAATLFVMTRFAERPCPEVAQMVIRISKSWQRTSAPIR